MLAIASGELGPGKRMPSTRALAKRFHLNANTVSAAYQQLESHGWVESIRGSGVYVRSKQLDPQGESDAMDQLVLQFIRAVRIAGLSANAIRNRVDYWLALRPRRFVFVHPEEAPRAIIAQELGEAMTWPVHACDLQPASLAQHVRDSIFVTVPSKQNMVRRLLPATSEVLTLQIHRIDQLLAPYLPIHPDVLLVIASAWGDFLRIARTMLTAAGCDPDAILLCDTSSDGWVLLLTRPSAVICDAFTSKSIPDTVRNIVVKLISDTGIARLKSFERSFAESDTSESV
jgi:DNA-binding transcriptional regulator YhcF (GntR family)